MLFTVSSLSLSLSSLSPSLLLLPPSLPSSLSPSPPSLPLSHSLSFSPSLPLIRFNHDPTILQPDLFDVFISYYHKPSVYNHTATPTSNTSLPSSAGPALLYETDNLDFPSITSVKSSQSETTPTQSNRNKGATTICDSELLLLLKGDRLPNWAISNKDKECSVFHHGSYLLYSQRGLLETLPLSYTCMSYTGAGTNVKNSIGPVNDNKYDAMKADSLLSAYLNVHKPAKTTGYMFSYRNNNNSSMKSSKLPLVPLEATPTTLPVTISNIPDIPNELFLFIDSLKPGCLYTGIIDFHSPIYLTDISIQLSAYMSSVAIDVWLEEESESQRIAISHELGTRSLLIGNITPPILCQYARVSYVGRIADSNARCAASLGCYYGLPYFNTDIPTANIIDNLSTEVTKVYNQYNKSREELLDTLAMYNHCSSSYILKQQMENQISTLHTGCFNSQAKLARLKTVLAQKQPFSRPNVYSIRNIQDEVTNVLPLKKLLKLTGCLIDTILITMESSIISLPPDMLQPLSTAMDQSDFRSLFLSHCVHGYRTLHARICAMLIRVCGNQQWWGSVLAELFKELYSTNQTNLFSKERSVAYMYMYMCI